MVLIDKHSVFEFYDAQKAKDIFSAGKNFFDNPPDFIANRMNPDVLLRIQKMLQYVEMNPYKLLIRAWQLNSTINYFNQIHLNKKVELKFPENRIQAIKLSNLLGNEVGKGMKLPNINYGDIPEDQNYFFAMFAKGIIREKYDFIDKLEDSEKLNDYLTTCFLVDGYAYGVKLMYINERNENIDGNLIVDTICELAGPGVLFEDMKAVNWYSPEFGYSPDFLREIGVNVPD